MTISDGSICGLAGSDVCPMVFIAGVLIASSAKTRPEPQSRPAKATAKRAVPLLDMKSIPFLSSRCSELGRQISPGGVGEVDLELRVARSPDAFKRTSVTSTRGQSHGDDHYQYTK